MVGRERGRKEALYKKEEQADTLPSASQGTASTNGTPNTSFSGFANSPLPVAGRRCMTCDTRVGKGELKREGKHM